MKIIALAFLSICSLAKAQDRVHLSQISDYNITYSIIGNERSTHYDQPVVLELRNSGQGDVVVWVPAGTIFEAVDSTVQDMVIFEDYDIIVHAGSTEKNALRGTCIEPHNRAPNGESRYRYSSNQNDKLNKTIAFLKDRGYSRATAQEAIWTVIQMPKNIELSGWNAKEINETGKFLAGLLNLPVPETIREDDPRLYSAPARRAKVSANFSFYFPEQKTVRVALFDLEGIMQRELYIRENARPGEYVVSFSFDGTPYIGSQYEFKLIADGEVLLVRTLDLR